MMPNLNAILTRRNNARILRIAKSMRKLCKPNAVRWKYCGYKEDWIKLALWHIKKVDEAWKGGVE
jgi:hypothetical protein